jgi:hypothetical protein
MKRMRPNGNTIAYYIEKLKEKPMSDRRLFMNGALDMVKSDGVIRCEDLEMMRALSLELTGVDI